MKLYNKAVDWSSPGTLVIFVLAILLGLAFLFFIWKLQRGVTP